MNNPWLFSLCLLTPLALATPPPASAPTQLSLGTERLKFTYQEFEGERNIRCSHKIENADSGDWRVLCQHNGFKREYSVHLWITRYTKMNAPRTSFETLYWVTEKYPQNRGYSSTNWLHLMEDSQFGGASLSVGVDDETAGLYLEVAP